MSALKLKTVPILMAGLKRAYTSTLRLNSQNGNLASSKWVPKPLECRLIHSTRVRLEEPIKRVDLSGHKPNNLERKLLVWFKKYPSESEVPNFVPQATMEKVRNRARIRLNIVFCVVTAAVSWVLIMRSKRSAEAGDTILKQNQELHRKYREEADAAAKK